MSPPRARIVRGSPAPGGDAPAPKPLLSLALAPPQRRRIAREEVEARLAAERMVNAAQSEGARIVARAKEEARIAAEQAAREARENAEALLSAKWLALHAAEATLLDRNVDRVASLAVALAERLIGAALELDPARVVELARAAIAEARGARRMTIEAHPLDADILRESLGRLAVAGFDPQSIEIRRGDALARGELRLKTDVGTIDGKLTPRLERLAAALRDALR